MNYPGFPESVPFSEEDIIGLVGRPEIDVNRGLQIRYLHEVRKKSYDEILNMPISIKPDGTRMTKQNIGRIINSPVFEKIEEFLDKFTSQ